MDLIVGNLAHPDSRGAGSNTTVLYKNGGSPDFKFTDVRRELGIKYFEFNSAALWLDIDNDGNLDLFHTNYAYNPLAKDAPVQDGWYSHIYMNKGETQNYAFKDATWELGPLVHGAWTAVRSDYDHDGDLDLFVACEYNQGIILFDNQLRNKGNYLEIKLKGNPAQGVCNDAFGTSVILTANGKKYRRDLMGGGEGTSASQNSTTLHFGLGNATNVDKLEVFYPNGKKQVLNSISVNQILNVDYKVTTSVESNDRNNPIYERKEMKLSSK